MKTKSKAGKVKKEPGYKGHRVGSTAEKAHKLVDDNPKAERADLIKQLKKLGVTEVTAGHWISVFRNWGTKAKTKPAKKSAPSTKKKTATNTAPKKTAVAAPQGTAEKPKKKPVIKKPVGTETTAGASTPAA